jgi:hypothetical protein
VTTAHPAKQQALNQKPETRKDDDPAACVAVGPATKTGMTGVTLMEAFTDLLNGGGKTCVSISRGAPNGRHLITWQHGLWRINPARAGACCATASSCSMTGANCFPMARL